MFETVEQLRNYINSIEIDCDRDDAPYEYRKDGAVLDQSFSTGGYSGGSCWNDDPAHPYSTDIEYVAEEGRLDRFLLDVFPDISFGKYKRIRTAVLSNVKREYNEYYGNSTAYSIWLIDVDKLFEMLDES